MSQISYAFIIDEKIINIAAFDSSCDAQTFAHFKEILQLDDIIEVNDKTVVGGSFDGTKFWLPQPYPSWIKNEELNEWQSPVPYPTVEKGDDEPVWDEETTSWLLPS